MLTGRCKNEKKKKGALSKNSADRCASKTNFCYVYGSLFQESV